MAEEIKQNYKLFDMYDVSEIKIEEDLKNSFPKNYWSKLNPITVKFGKKYTSRKEKDKILEKIKRI